MSQNCEEKNRRDTENAEEGDGPSSANPSRGRLSSGGAWLTGGKVETPVMPMEGEAPGIYKRTAAHVASSTRPTLAGKAPPLSHAP